MSFNSRIAWTNRYVQLETAEAAQEPRRYMVLNQEAAREISVCRTIFQFSQKKEPSLRAV